MSTSQNLTSSCTGTEEELLQRIRQLAANYKGKEGSLIQVLHMVQSVYGYLPLNVQRIVAEELEVPLSTVSGVVSFYSFLQQRRGAATPSRLHGNRLLRPRRRRLSEALEKQLASGGGTTPDASSLEICTVLGSCGLAPDVRRYCVSRVQASDLRVFLSLGITKESERSKDMSNSSHKEQAISRSFVIRPQPGFTYKKHSLCVRGARAAPTRIGGQNAVETAGLADVRRHPTLRLRPAWSSAGLRRRPRSVFTAI